ncbi:hypothetical protein Tco_1354274 [Tanacetum coccineum]
MLDRHRHRRHSLSISKSGQWYFDISLLTMSMAAGIISCTVKAVSGTRLGCALVQTSQYLTKPKLHVLIQSDPIQFGSYGLTKLAQYLEESRVEESRWRAVESERLEVASMTTCLRR